MTNKRDRLAAVRQAVYLYGGKTSSPRRAAAAEFVWHVLRVFA